MPRPPLSRAVVVEQARTLVRADGVQGVGLRRVARELGVTAPALYAHVSDYDDLLAAVAEGEFARLRAAFEAVDVTDPLDRLRALGRAYVAHARAEPHLHRLMFRYPPKLAEAGVPLDFGPATDAFAVALAAVEQAIDRDLLAVTDPIVVALALWSAAHGVAEVLLMGFDFDDATAQAVTEVAVDASVDGLRRP
ncbi:MAG TPA: TetR/AcrR family transcriptional regulator [Acidimicrobiales bacterium]|nr:TetR/AcrR family transcriptional regulator [Acidimicrobiales bacterium]